MMMSMEEETLDAVKATEKTLDAAKLNRYP
jgi:hypothetical protein